jgi:hypothetical protein
MVELYQYLLLSRDERATYLWENGEFITNTKESEYSYSLYALNGYYVEVRISNADNSITEIVPFKKGELLNKYIESIDISDEI